MTRTAPVLTITLLLMAPAHAQDAAKGEAEFRKCRACHSIIAPDGTAVVKGGKTGPNLYGVIGRAVAATDFAYGPGLVAAGATGAVWDETSLATYAANPSAWVQTLTGDPAAKSNMSFRLAKGGADVAAYLAAVARSAP